MALDKWLRLIDTLSGLASASRRLIGNAPSADQGLAPTGALGQLETRLAGVVVAALKEAFDRDRARLDLEKAHVEAERQRAEEALRLELLRQAGDRALMQVRLMAGMSLVVWVTSTILIGQLPAMSDTLPRAMLASGWFVLISALAAAFIANNTVVSWLSAARSSRQAPELPRGTAGAALPWLFVTGLALTAASLLAGL